MADFIAGTIAGCAGQIVGHPLDSIKTRLQSEALLTSSSGQRRQTSAYRCARSIYSEGGIRAFFRGLSLPLLSKGFEQSVAFGITNWTNYRTRSLLYAGKPDWSLLTITPR